MRHMIDRLRQLERAVQRAGTPAARVDALNALAFEMHGNDPAAALSLCEEAHVLAGEEGYVRGRALALRTMGYMHLVRLRHDLAHEKLEEAQRILEEAGDTQGLASVYLGLAQILRGHGHSPEALDHARRALKLYRACGDRAGEAEALMSVGLGHAVRAGYSTALHYFNKALAICGEGDARISAAAIELNIAHITRARGRLAEASAQLFALLPRCREGNDRRAEARTLCSLAQISSQLGDYPAALRYFHESDTLARAIDDVSTLADALRGRGVIHKLMGDFPTALECGEHSLELARAAGNRYHEAVTLNALGNVYYPMDDLDTALSYFRESAETAAAIARRDVEVVAVENIGNVMRDRRQYAEAESYYERSIALAEEIGDVAGIASCRFNIGRMWLDREHYTAAVDWLRRALETAAGIGLTPMMGEIHNDLANAYRLRGKRGDVHTAFEHLSEYLRIRSELMGRERLREMAAMVHRIEMERVRQEREEYRREKERLELDVQRKAEELNAMAIRLVQNGELIVRLREELHRAIAEGAPAETLASLRRRVDEGARAEGEWRAFQEKLQAVHHGFLVEMARRYPVLKPAELKVCVLLRTQLSTKEIANLLMVTDRAVEKLRYQIRKKIELPQSVNLPAYLSSI